MALELPNSIFFHVGRTAGHWVRYVIKKMDIPTMEIGEFHDWPSRITMMPAQERKLKFCFIRHPLEWLRSYWLHEMYFGWSTDMFAQNIKADTFADFLSNSIRVYANGPVSNVYAPFIEQCGFVGRQESIVGDLLCVLEQAEKKVVPRVIYETKAINVDIPADMRRYAVAPESLLEQVMESEKALCQKWGYSDIPSSLVGEPRILVSLYVPLDRPSAGLPDTDALAEHQFDNSFSIGDLRISGKKDNIRTTKIIKDVLERIDFTGKSVVDTACGDGIFALFAEACGASKVVAVDSKLMAGTVSVLGPALRTRVDFRRGSFYGLDREIGERFDIVFCFRLLETLRYPFLAFRTLSRLLNNGGILVLECGYLKALEDKPILLCPFGLQVPVLPEYCTYFNKKGLIDALSAFGFTDVEICYEFQHALPAGRGFDELNIPQNEFQHASESQVGRVVLICRWRSSGYGQHGEPPTTAYLMDYWDSRLPFTDIPMYQPELELISFLREQFSGGLCKVAELEDNLRCALLTIGDRERDLVFERNELQALGKVIEERTAELVETREVLLERTRRLEACEKKS